MLWKKRRIYDYAISMGVSCQPAWHLAKNGLRDRSYPMDWIDTRNTDSLCAVLSNGFEDFFEKHLLEPEFSGIRNQLRFRNKKYGFLFQYGFNGLDSFDEDFEATKEVYRRRIARLEERLASDASVLFVRLHSNPEDAEKIASTLTREYPNLDFTLLALDNTEENRKDWGIPGVISRYIDCAPRHDATNQKYDGNWKKVLREFKVRKGADSPREQEISPLD
jgi:hypothetical protein